MKKYLFIILLVGVWSCEDKREEDTTPPTVTITSPQSNSEVSESVSITCMASDNEGVEKVELWVNGVFTGIADQTEPFSLDWNTNNYANDDYTIIIRVYDINGNTTDSEPLVLNVINEIQDVTITSVTYDTENMVINWSLSNVDHFLNYQVFESESQTGSKELIATYTDQSVISHSISNFNPNEQKWFWVSVSDTLGRNQLSEGITNELNSPPIVPILERIVYNNGFQFKWSKCDEFDFQKYIIYRLNDQGQQASVVYETTNVNDTLYILTNVTENGVYHVEIVDHWGLVSNSEAKQLVAFVELWYGESYSIESITSSDQINWGEGEILPEIGFLTNLREISISGDNISGSLPPELGYLINLEELNITNSLISGTIPPQLGNLSNLTRLNLGRNQLTGFIPSQLGELESLTYLNLRENELTGSIPAEFENLENLTYLNLRDNQLSGSIPSEIGNLLQLQFFYGYNNSFSGSIPSEIGNLVNLGTLDLNGNQLTGSLPVEIGNMVSLGSLNLQNNQISGSLPTEIGNINGLSSIRLENNQISGSIPTEIANINGLTTLGLSLNDLTGEIPTQLFSMSGLHTIYLSNNNLSGEIPINIGDLEVLGTLYLNNNNLSGTIPSSIGDLTNLNILNLKNNSLSGVIPDEICNVDNATISLGNNNLCPSYPSCLTEDEIGTQDTEACD